MAQEDDEDEDRGKGLEPTLEEILRAQNNSATATANDVIDSKADVSGVEVVEPSEAEQMHEPVVEAAAEEAEEDKGQTNGGEATTTIGQVPEWHRLIRSTLNRLPPPVAGLLRLCPLRD